MKSFTEDENKVLEIDVKGPAVVTAGDIKHDSDIQVLNPDLYICTVAEGYHFHVRMNAKKMVVDMFALTTINLIICQLV